jgi:superfamily II DNA or RNA helicase
MQTLRSRDVDKSWWRRWGLTVADEVHHVGSGSTYNELIKNVCSRYVVGVTATPLERMWEQPLLTHVVGPIFHVTTDEDLRKVGLRMMPKVKQVRTGWAWDPNAYEAKLVDSKAIYRHVVKALEEDEGRAELVAGTICAQPPECAQLVLSKRLGYIDTLVAALERLGYQGAVLMLRGSERRRSVEISEQVSQGGCVLLSTVAGEGTDIPRLDRLHLSWPMRKELSVVQAVGRVLRVHPDKKDVVVFDYVDAEGMLVAQANERTSVYRKAGYKVERT